MNFCCSFHAGDKDQAARLLAWIRELGGFDKHRLFVMPAKGQVANFTDAPPFQVVADNYGITSDWSGNGAVRDAAGANSTIRQFAWRFYQSGLGPWMFLEPDAIPLVPEWADRIEDEYKRAGKLYMGARVPGKPGEYDDHSTGNMVLPQDVAAMSQGLMVPRHAVIAGKQIEVAFDVAAASDVLANFHDTPLLQHVFRGPEFDTPADLQRIRSGAVLFHTDKTGGLIRLLREQRFGARHGAVREVQTGAIASPSETPRTKVFTYLSLVQSDEGRREQQKLIELWHESWGKHGFEPVILTEADASTHPKFAEWKAKFERLPTVNPKGYELACWLRWVAMIQVALNHPTAHQGLLTDYDVLCFSSTKYSSIETDPTPLILGDHVPCAVVGTARQYALAVNAFFSAQPEQHEGHPHLSDMLAARQLGFKSLGVCKEYKAPGWESADMVHFSHAACHPENRSDVIARGRPETLNPLLDVSAKTIQDIHAVMAECTMPESVNGSAPDSIASLIRDGVGILSQLATGPSRKKKILDELRKAGLVSPAKKRGRRKMEMAA